MCFYFISGTTISLSITYSLIFKAAFNKRPSHCSFDNNFDSNELSIGITHVFAEIERN
jgi:hypothetical protein